MTTTSASAASDASSLLWQRLAAGMIGLFIVGFVGFSQMSAMHNASHDYRHSMAFPCH